MTLSCSHYKHVVPLRECNRSSMQLVFALVIWCNDDKYVNRFISVRSQSSIFQNSSTSEHTTMTIYSSEIQLNMSCVHAHQIESKSSIFSRVKFSGICRMALHSTDCMYFNAINTHLNFMCCREEEKNRKNYWENELIRFGIDQCSTTNKNLEVCGISIWHRFFLPYK